MFDLEAAAGEWRRQLAARGIKSCEVLDELEGHLRDDFETQQRAGLTPPKAFEAAVASMGHAGLLQAEFSKVSLFHGLHDGLRHVIFTLAGIPNPTLATTMNTSNPHIEPWWATYLKGAAFVGPALFLWAIATVFFVPKLKQICLQAGLPNSGDRIWSLTHSNFQTIGVFADYGLFMAMGLVLGLILLEWRSGKWHRYRRATIGIGAFLLNLLVLISIFMMILTALVAAPALVQQAK
jgi:hypothetical protein